MNKICSSCIYKMFLNKHYPCLYCINNEINKNKPRTFIKLSKGTVKIKLKNYYKENKLK